MCGIIGFVDKKNQLSLANKRQLAQRMLDRLEYRGRDSSALVVEDNLVVGQTRLAILDSSNNALQPKTCPDYIFSYNGEIYNHLDLRKKYIPSANLSSYSDVVTFFRLVQKFSFSEIYDDLWGMFACCVYEKKSRNARLAVDPFGIKPLYYFEDENWFAWGSEMKIFNELPAVSFELNENTLYEQVIFRHIYGKETLVKNVYKVLPSQIVTYNISTGKIQYDSVGSLLNSKAEGRLEDVLEQSVKAHLLSDKVPGVQLSGGVDSSLIAYYAQRNTKEKMHTFSVGMNDVEWNEFMYSDMVAARLNTRHHKVVFSGKDFMQYFDKITYFLDEPVAHSNTIPLYMLALEARKFTNVLLTGEGADELFLGYKRYQDEECGVLFSNAFTHPKDVERVLKCELKSNLSARKDLISSFPDEDLQSSKARYDLKTYLPQLLLRQDRAGMAANVECRVPFLYPTVYKVSQGMSTRDKFFSLRGKDCLKNIALQFFSESLVLRKKCGFGLPIRSWLSEGGVLFDDVEKLVTDPIIVKYFSVDSVRSIIKENQNNVDHSNILFTLVSLCRWHKVFFTKKNENSKI